MSLITDISRIVNELYPDATFILSSKFNAGVAVFLSTITEFPLIILDNELPNTGSIQKNNNVLKDSRILISILALDSTDNSDQQSEDIRAAMEVIADTISGRLYLELPIRVQSSNQQYKVTPMFHVFSSNLTGVALEMQVNYNSLINM